LFSVGVLPSLFPICDRKVFFSGDIFSSS
jgi:hypothetical protein